MNLIIFVSQVFEGIAIGGRLATVNPGSLKWSYWKLWFCGIIYGLTTPTGIAIGIAIRKDFDLQSEKPLILIGIFDSISAGLLLYGGLVGLLSRDFYRSVYLYTLTAKDK
jgi:zinc transporter 1/2/3